VNVTSLMQPKTDDERKATLQTAIGQQVRMGWRVESQTDFQAILAKGKNHSHVLHLILTLVTLGLWLLVWIPLSIFGGEKRAVLTVNEQGRANLTK